MIYIKRYLTSFNINIEIHKASEEEIKGAISRTTGKDDTSVSRYLATFKILTSLAKFGASPKLAKPQLPEKEEEPVPIQKPKLREEAEAQEKGLSFHHNIEIHLPATTDVSVYNAIFKSLRENLLD